MKEHYLFESRHIAKGALLNDDVWADVPALDIAWVHPQTGDHRPRTRFRGVHSNDHIVGRFDVEDRYVLATTEHDQGQVCCDSCVEFFIQPLVDQTPNRFASGPADRPAYFNFEFSISGKKLCYYINPGPEGAKRLYEYVKLDQVDLDAVTVESSHPGLIAEEIVEPMQWSLAFSVPRQVLEPYAGPLGDFTGQQWRANLYKCANDSSHPHWISWQPLGAKDFHRVGDFGSIQFG